jgi:hypothetical protein
MSVIEAIVLHLAARVKVSRTKTEDESASQLLQKVFKRKALMSQVGTLSLSKQLSLAKMMSFLPLKLILDMGKLRGIFCCNVVACLDRKHPIQMWVIQLYELRECSRKESILISYERRGSTKLPPSVLVLKAGRRFLSVKVVWNSGSCTRSESDVSFSA